MRNYLEDFNRNIKLIDCLLGPLNQSVLKSASPRGFWDTILHFWPLWYNGFYMLFFLYLISVERAGLWIAAQQFWCLNSVTQTFVKYFNGLVQSRRIQWMVNWCADIYSITPTGKYSSITAGVFEKTNPLISLLIRINTLVIVVTVLSYLAQPMVAGNNGTPTLISINGTTDWSLSVYCLIYASQAIYAFSVLFSMGAYDAIFIQCIMVLLYRFRTMSHILRLLDESGERSPVEDKEILVDVYKMQLDVLGATQQFRKYYSVYGIIQMGNNLLVNGCLLFVLQEIGFDIGSVSVWVSSTIQVLISCALGQMLQNEARDYSDTFYQIDWLKLSIPNRKYLLLMMIGSHRKVNVRAGGAYELNLSLFLQIMKTTATMCAVLRAI